MKREIAAPNFETKSCPSSPITPKGFGKWTLECFRCENAGNFRGVCPCREIRQ